MLESFFFHGDLPPNVERGVYQLPLVVLSYLVAGFASYTALSMAQQLVAEQGRLEKRLFHWGGAFAMGAGVWSMHFIGMLSYKMRMIVTYDWELTFLSLLISIVVAYWTVGIVAHPRLSPQRLLTGAVFLGLGISGMHYTGMAAMKIDGELRYIPGIFFLSVAIAITASAAALWMTFTLSRHAGKFRDLLQIGAALIMGTAICGMHYTGMAAAVFTPHTDGHFNPDQSFDSLALTVAIITSIILSIALSIGIFKRARAESLLQSKNTALRLLIDSSLDAVIAMNQQGQVTEWNAQAANIFGWSHEAAVGKQLHEMIIPAMHRHAHSKGLQKFLKEGVGPILDRRVEMQALHRSGAEFPIELSVTAQKFQDGYQFTAFARDISERKLAEKKLQAAHQYLKNMLDNIPDPIFMKDRQHRWIDGNKPFWELMQGPPEKYIGKSDYEFFPKEEADVFWEKDDKVFNSGGVDINEESFTDFRGEKHIFSTKKVAFHNEEGDPFLVGVIRDITDLKKTEAQLLKYTKDLERSNQELEDFAHIASHDLKEPLRGLGIQASFLMEDFKDKLGPEGLRRLTRLTQLSQRMEDLINDLLRFSQLGSAEMAVQEVDPRTIVRDIKQMMETFLKERHAHIIMPQAMPKTVCDKTKITEVFRNLITNAIKYNDKPEPQVEVGFLDCCETPQGEEHNVFYVKDNGIGIESRYHQEIFRIFRRIAPAAEGKESGTGVGLSLVKRIIERHNGRIWLDSKPEQGSIFYFTIGRIQ